jgi:hypothetical protein
VERRGRKKGRTTSAGTMLALGATTTLVRQALYRTVQCGASAQPTGARASSPTWSGWTWGLTIVVALAVLVVWWVLLRRQAKRFRQKYLLEITNLGNVRSQYALQADDPAGALRFTFVAGDLPLSGQMVAQPEPVAARPTQTEAVVPTHPTSSDLRAGVDTIKSAKGTGMRLGSTVANALGSLGNLLPRSVGAPLLSAAAQIRRGQSSVRRVEQLPGRARRVSSRAAPRRTTARPRPAASSRQEPAPPTTAIQTIEQGWVETPFVEPGETLVIDLSIDPDDPYQTQTYPFVVESWSLEQREGSLIIEESSVQIVKPTFLQRYSPFMVTTIVAVAIWLLARAVIGTGF